MKVGDKHWFPWLMLVAIVSDTGQHSPGQPLKSSATLQGHTQAITALAFSPNGGLLASASSDGTVRLWDVQTGKKRASLRGQRGGPKAIAFQPTGRLLTSNVDNGVIRLWDAFDREGKPLRDEYRYVNCLAFSPGGSMLAIGGGKLTEHGNLRLWNLRAAKENLAFWGLPNAVTAVSLSWDGRMLASGDFGGTLTVWEVVSGRRRAVFKGGSGFVRSLAFLPGGDLLASGDSSGVVRLWDIRTATQRGVLKGHTNVVHSVAGAGLLLCSAGEEGTIRLWKISTGKQLLVLKLDRPVRSVAFSLDGKLLASGDLGGTIHLWSVSRRFMQKGTD